MRESARRKIFEKTQGHCHFCGDPIEFEKRGWNTDLNGHWEVNHVIQRHKGGSLKTGNCLPTCTRCNRLRWHRTGDSLRNLLLIGLIGTDEIKRSTQIGKKLEELKQRRLDENLTRRSTKRRP